MLGGSWRFGRSGAWNKMKSLNGQFGSGLAGLSGGRFGCPGVQSWLECRGYRSSSFAPLLLALSP
jgi:hypothetical protein